MPDDFRTSDYALDERTQVIEVVGQIDLYSAAELKERASHVMDAGNPHVIVDLSGVKFMDSTGLGVLIGMLKRVRAGSGTLALVVTSYDIERLLEITGLDRSFTIYRSLDEARSALANSI